MTISLRPLRDSDLDSFFDWERDPAAVRMAAFTRTDPSDRAAFDAHWQRVRADPTVRNLAIESDERLVGSIATFTMEGDRELTYWIAPDAWGRGIATAAVWLMLEIETERPLYGRVAADNLGSRRVLAKCGFVAVGEEISFAPGRGEEIRELVVRLE